MKERQWTELVTNLQHGNCILFLGTELPLPINKKVFKELIQYWIKSADVENIKDDTKSGSKLLTFDKDLWKVKETLPITRYVFKEHIIKELKADVRRILEDHFRAVAQQYEDDRDFGSDSLRAEASPFYKKDLFEPSEIHRILATSLLF